MSRLEAELHARGIEQHVLDDRDIVVHPYCEHCYVSGVEIILVIVLIIELFAHVIFKTGGQFEVVYYKVAELQAETEACSPWCLYFLTFILIGNCRCTRAALDSDI